MSSRSNCSTKTFTHAKSQQREYQLAYDCHNIHPNRQIVQLARANRDTARVEKELAVQRVKEAELLLNILREDETRSTTRLAEANAQVKAVTHFTSKSRVLPGELNKDITSSSSDLEDSKEEEDEDEDMDEFFYSLASEPGQPLTEAALQALSTPSPSASSSRVDPECNHAS
ncbi:hypothetical protein DXG01_012983 [Tephrocybe rancida]|nr:hypothetical protein DXG01_012983 [Tephrocybe rancida]